MTMDLAMVGASHPTTELSWTATDAILYALGVGAGREPAEELHLTTENSAGVAQQVLPAYGLVLAMSRGPRLRLGDYSSSQVLHGEQSFTVHQPLPVEGRAIASAVCTGIYDKGSGALAVTETTLSDADSGAPLFTSRTGLFVRGEGGFGGPRPEVEPWDVADREPDRALTFEVRPDQALLYRLSGDRNPLHSDPDFARRAGFARPILHGLCTYGITARLLAGVLCDGDTDRVRSMSGRFTRPVLPGAALTVNMWTDRGLARFRTHDDTGAVVIDRGTFTWNEEDHDDH